MSPESAIGPECSSCCRLYPKPQPLLLASFPMWESVSDTESCLCALCALWEWYEGGITPGVLGLGVGDMPATAAASMLLLPCPDPAPPRAAAMEPL